MTPYTMIDVPPRLPALGIDVELTTLWLVAFLRDELITRRGMHKAVLGLSGGVDSAVVAALCVQALGAENVTAFRLPYRTSSPDSLIDAQEVARALDIDLETLDISAAVDGYLQYEPHADARGVAGTSWRVCGCSCCLINRPNSAHCLSVRAIKRNVYSDTIRGMPTTLRRSIPSEIFSKRKCGLLLARFRFPHGSSRKRLVPIWEANQTDEADLGITYAKADKILALMLQGYLDETIIERGLDAADVATVRHRLDATHWKRHLPTTAMLSSTAINEFYLRPVDF